MTDAARNLAVAVLIYHSSDIDLGRDDPARLYDTFERWQAATGTSDCSAAALCELAQKVLTELAALKEPDRMSIFPENQQTEATEIGMEIGRVRDMLSEAEACPILTEYEQKWCSDLYERVNRWAEATWMTEKQWGVFERIEKKIQSMEI